MPPRAGRPKTHGHQVNGKKSREYQSWTNAKSRCFNTALPSYVDYGARGITMCPEWRESFEAFLRDMGPRPLGATLDRIDPHGPYGPGNCRWATRTVQQNNQRANRLLTFRGETKTVAEWARTLGIRDNTLRTRLHAGWPVERVLS